MVNPAVLLLNELAFLIVFILGAAVGSFLNVVIYRVPAGLSILTPPSHCPHCRQRLKFYDNIPILGWLLLKGRCRSCRAAIACRYPLVEAITGVLFLAAFWQFGVSWYTVSVFALIGWLLALAFIDIDTLTLPNELTQSGLVAGAVLCTLRIGAAHHGSPVAFVQGFMTAVLGAVVGLWLFDLISLGGALLAGKTVMGGGDGKLAALLGTWLGWQGVLLCSFLACAMGAFIGGGAIALGWLRRQTPIPFGPYLALGGLMTVFWGDRLVGWYLHTFFPFLE